MDLHLKEHTKTINSGDGDFLTADTYWILKFLKMNQLQNTRYNYLFTTLWVKERVKENSKIFQK